jgi:uncharacterized protein YneF (UPF0154 family)
MIIGIVLIITGLAFLGLAYSTFIEMRKLQHELKNEVNNK